MVMNKLNRKLIRVSVDLSVTKSPGILNISVPSVPFDSRVTGITICSFRLVDFSNRVCRSASDLPRSTCGLGPVSRWTQYITTFVAPTPEHHKKVQTQNTDVCKFFKAEKKEIRYICQCQPKQKMGKDHCAIVQLCIVHRTAI